MRRLFATALIAIAFLGITPNVAHAESSANTPRLALNKVQLWLAAAESKPSGADLDAGMSATSAAEERVSMINTEIAAMATRRRTLQLQAAAARQKIAELRAVPKGENGIKKSGSEQKIVELTQKAEQLDAQAETLYGYIVRVSEEENAIVDAVGRVRAVTDLIETSTIAGAAQKQKAATLATKTTKTFKLHAVLIMTVMQASQGRE